MLPRRQGTNNHAKRAVQAIPLRPVCLMRVSRPFLGSFLRMLNTVHCALRLTALLFPSHERPLRNGCGKEQCYWIRTDMGMADGGWGQGGGGVRAVGMLVWRERQRRRKDRRPNAWREEGNRTETEHGTTAKKKRRHGSWLQWQESRGEKARPETRNESSHLQRDNSFQRPELRRSAVKREPGQAAVIQSLAVLVTYTGSQFQDKHERSQDLPGLFVMAEACSRSAWEGVRERGLV